MANPTNVQLFNDNGEFNRNGYNAIWDMLEVFNLDRHTAQNVKDFTEVLGWYGVTDDEFDVAADYAYDNRTGDSV